MGTLKAPRILFCGSNLAGTRVLSDLLSTPASFSIIEVWTSEDPEAKADPESSVFILAEKQKLPIFTGNPRKGIDTASLSLRGLDLILCVNYRYILTREIYKAARLGAINIHGSLLPAYRGRTPNTWAIINGETETGVTVHVIDDGIDTGPILCQSTIPITLHDTGHSLSLKLTSVYPQLVREAIRKIQEKTFAPIPQDESKATVFPKRNPDDGRIDWTWTAKRIFDWVRAQTAPYPGAFTYLRGIKMTVWEAEWVQQTSSPIVPAGRPGEVVGLCCGAGDSHGGVFVSCGDGSLVLLRSVQREGEDACHASDLVARGDAALGELLHEVAEGVGGSRPSL